MEVAQAIEPERMLFRACVYLGISQKRNWSVEASCIFEVFHSVKVNYQIIKIRHFLRLRITQKALQLSLFSSFCYSLQQIWMDWQNLLVQFSRFVKLGVCSNSDTLKNMWELGKLGACDHYLVKFHEKYLKTYSEAV